MPRRIGPGALIALMVAAVAAAAGAQIVVIRAQGPSAAAYPAGALLAPGKPLLLVEGDHLSLLEGGAVRDIDGPGRVVLGRRALQAKPPLVSILDQDQKTRHRVGAARGLGPTTIRVSAVPNSIWQMDIASPGNFCVAAGQPVALWRRGVEAAAVSIERASDQSRRMVNWPAGNLSLAWPADLPLNDGETYQVTSTDRGIDGGVVTWRTVDPPSGDFTEFARQLIDRQCFAQLDTLYASIPADGP